MLLKPLFFLLLVSPAVAAEDSPGLRTAVGSAKADAAALMQQGKYASAYEMYMRPLREAPDDDEINLNLARSSMHSGRYNQAVMAYERLTEKHRASQCCSVNWRKPIWPCKTASAERAMATARELNPNISKADNDRLLDSLKNAMTNGRYTARRSGLLYDSNATFWPLKHHNGYWQAEGIRAGRRGQGHLWRLPWGQP